METYTACYKSPLGNIEIVGTHESIVELNFVEHAAFIDSELPFCVKACHKQIDEYFGGQRQEFLLSLSPIGTAFQKSVWKELEKIPYGNVASYQDIANAIGKPNACRAVGGANGKNPISIIIPCHRIIGSDGRLTGYGGGLWRKEWLLKHEREYHTNNIIA